MYMCGHIQFSGANPERLVAAIKYFLQGKGAEKGLRWEEWKDGRGWEEGRKDGEGWVEGRKDGRGWEEGCRG